MSTVQDILLKKGREVATIGAADTVLDGARLMNDRGIGGLVVIEGDRVIGVFTERDILRRIVAVGRDPATTSVRDVMTSPVVSCRPETTLEECRGVMSGKHIRHLPVIDQRGLCGIVTSGDVLAFNVLEHEETIQVLNSYVYGVR
jgi:CBS domain-containing protein